MALRGLSQYYMEGRETCPENTVVLGYASLRDEEIPALAEALKRAWLPSWGQEINGDFREEKKGL